MVSQDSLLVTLIKLVDRLPLPALPTKRGRGHPKVYTDRLFLKALVIMIVRHLHNVHELLSILAQPTAEMRRLHEVLSEHGWVYGWKLHVVSVVAAVWFPIAAVLTPANVADSEPAPDLLREVPAEVRFILGDRHYNTPDLHQTCAQADRLLVTTQYGRYPHPDDGVEVRRLFHKLRSTAMENINELIFGIFDGHGQVPTKGLLATQRFALGAIFIYQLALLYRFEHDLELCVGLKAFLKAA